MTVGVLILMAIAIIIGLIKIKWLRITLLSIIGVLVIAGVSDTESRNKIHFDTMLKQRSMTISFLADYSREFQKSDYCYTDACYINVLTSTAGVFVDYFKDFNSLLKEYGEKTL